MGDQLGVPLPELVQHRHQGHLRVALQRHLAPESAKEVLGVPQDIGVTWSFPPCHGGDCQLAL
eukprot:8822347-Alexandrium_andersonii.AAC.1